MIHAIIFTQHKSCGNHTPEVAWQFTYKQPHSNSHSHVSFQTSESVMVVHTSEITFEFGRFSYSFRLL